MNLRLLETVKQLQHQKHSANKTVSSVIFFVFVFLTTSFFLFHFASPFQSFCFALFFSFSCNTICCRHPVCFSRLLDRNKGRKVKEKERCQKKGKKKLPPICSIFVLLTGFSVFQVLFSFLWNVEREKEKMVFFFIFYWPIKCMSINF